MDNEFEQIGIQDLLSLLEIINLAAQRGAFKPQEFSRIGSSIDKVNGFISHIKSQQDQNSKSIGDK